MAKSGGEVRLACVDERRGMYREFRFLPRGGETPRGFCHPGLIDYSARY